MLNSRETEQTEEQRQAGDTTLQEATVEDSREAEKTGRLGTDVEWVKFEEMLQLQLHRQEGRACGRACGELPHPGLLRVLLRLQQGLPHPSQLPPPLLSRQALS